ncbi:MAG TPA: hypothetical protein VHA73_08815 [Acidimicrobiales bacterium]|nr:hypothetical protein [Acidimicrobiales bacterium]
MDSIAESAREPAQRAVDEAFNANTTNRAAIVDNDVHWASALVDNSGLPDIMAEWEHEDRVAPGGAPRRYPIRALLVAMTLAARFGEPQLLTNFRDILFERISPTARASLGVPEPAHVAGRRGRRLQREAQYRTVRTRFQTLVALVGGRQIPNGTRLTPDELAARTKDGDPERIERCEERLHRLVNAVLEASVQQVPPELRRRWEGSVAVDATPVPVWARPPRYASKKTNAKARIEQCSAEPEAGWYMRHRDRRDGADDGPAPPPNAGTKVLRKSLWTYEATLVVSGAAEAEADGTFPYLVVGMAPLHKPGSEPGPNALRALTSIRDRGHPARYVAGDRAYSNAKPGTFQLPARALGYEPVFDYRDDQLGVQATHEGALQVEGGWYCPSMPRALVNATADYRAGRITSDVYYKRIAARRDYLMRQKARPDADGFTRLTCPAAGPSPAARCDLKPRSLTDKTGGKTHITLVDDVQAHPPKVCKQATVSFPPIAGAKFAQPLQYASRSWQYTYSTLRNAIEGFNGYAKDTASDALASAGRRRVHGRAAQSVLVAFTICGVNLRKLRSFLRLAEDDGSGTLRKPRRKRRLGPVLRDHLPSGAKSGLPNTS